MAMLLTKRQVNHKKKFIFYSINKKKMIINIILVYFLKYALGLGLHIYDGAYELFILELLHFFSHVQIMVKKCTRVGV